MQQILILSDTHGLIDRRVLALAEGCDAIVHGGDIGCGAVIDRLSWHAPVTAVAGNNDTERQWPVQEAERCRALAASQRLPLPGGELVVEHGHRFPKPATRHQRLRDAHPDARAIVYGHSHQLVIDDQAAPWVINPGAAGRARTHGGPSCLLLTVEGEDWRITAHRFELPAETA